LIYDKGSDYRKDIKNIKCFLPVEKIEEVADFVLKKYEEYILQNGIYKIVEGSQAFNFLNEEEVLYSKKILKKILMPKGNIVLIPFPFTDLSATN